MFRKINYLFAILLTLVIFACNEDDAGSDASITISIDQNPVDYAPVDLDVEAQAGFSGHISSESNLVKVTISVDSDQGRIMIDEATSFDGNARSYDFDVQPDYALGMTTLIATAENESGDIVEESRKINVKGGPVLALDVTEFIIDLSVEATGTLTGNVTSAKDILSQVDYTLISGDVRGDTKTVTLSGADKSSYDISEVFTFEMGMTALEVAVTDDRGNVTTNTLTVSVVASPVFLYYEYIGKELHGTDKRKTAGNGIGIALTDGKVYDMATITADPDGMGIDFMITNADNTTPKVRFYSPSSQNGDKFKLSEINGELNLNTTTFSVLDRGDEAFFDAATKDDIMAMTLTDEGASTRDTDIRGLADGSSNVDIVGGRVIYFETQWGAQCLVRLREVKENPESSTMKGDYYVMDFKVVYQDLN
ncbi:hypothetical protein SAMN04488028_108100 [Reichenbachiella agariperforans]|uniref:Uncharacterized protein n=1 Tax=Reichenbachiella agariperforans TaxID=156994 RepID=A0A1M6V327_REIAG|nr:hypothetical protein [Reichenbachiella agariperforans]SHK75853.1 hypothetical protein SAMN04488028_108100 [Reichenbachiella agariperforans]